MSKRPYHALYESPNIVVVGKDETPKKIPNLDAESQPIDTVNPPGNHIPPCPNVIMPQTVPHSYISNAPPLPATFQQPVVLMSCLNCQQNCTMPEPGPRSFQATALPEQNYIIPFGASDPAGFQQNFLPEQAYSVPISGYVNNVSYPVNYHLGPEQNNLQSYNYPASSINQNYGNCVFGVGGQSTMYNVCENSSLTFKNNCTFSNGSISGANTSQYSGSGYSIDCAYDNNTANSSVIPKYSNTHFTNENSAVQISGTTSGPSGYYASSVQEYDPCKAKTSTQTSTLGGVSTSNAEKTWTVTGKETFASNTGDTEISTLDATTKTNNHSKEDAANIMKQFPKQGQKIEDVKKVEPKTSQNSKKTSWATNYLKKIGHLPIKINFLTRKNEKASKDDIVKESTEKNVNCTTYSELAIDNQNSKKVYTGTTIKENLKSETQNNETGIESGSKTEVFDKTINTNEVGDKTLNINEKLKSINNTKSKNNNVEDAVSCKSNPINIDSMEHASSEMQNASPKLYKRRSPAPMPPIISSSLKRSIDREYENCTKYTSPVKKERVNCSIENALRKKIDSTSEMQNASPKLYKRRPPAPMPPIISSSLKRSIDREYENCTKYTSPVKKERVNCSIENALRKKIDSSESKSRLPPSRISSAVKRPTDRELHHERCQKNSCSSSRERISNGDEQKSEKSRFRLKPHSPDVRKGSDNYTNRPKSTIATKRKFRSEEPQRIFRNISPENRRYDKKRTEHEHYYRKRNLNSEYNSQKLNDIEPQRGGSFSPTDNRNVTDSNYIRSRVLNYHETDRNYNKYKYKSTINRFAKNRLPSPSCSTNDDISNEKDNSKVFDLRSILSRKNVLHYLDSVRKYRADNDTTQRDQLLITVQNENPDDSKMSTSFDTTNLAENICNDSKALEKPTVVPNASEIVAKQEAKADTEIEQQKNNENKTEIEQKTKSKKAKKFKVVINVICESSDNEESQEDTNIGTKSNEDLSFLDDFNIDEIVECLASLNSENKVSTASDLIQFIDLSNLDSDDSDSDASTVVLEELSESKENLITENEQKHTNSISKSERSTEVNLSHNFNKIVIKTEPPEEDCELLHCDHKLLKLKESISENNNNFCLTNLETKNKTCEATENVAISCKTIKKEVMDDTEQNIEVGIITAETIAASEGKKANQYDKVSECMSKISEEKKQLAIDSSKNDEKSPKVKIEPHHDYKTVENVESDKILAYNDSINVQTNIVDSCSLRSDSDAVKTYTNVSIKLDKENQNSLTELHQDESLANTGPPISDQNEENTTQSNILSLERVMDKENVNLDNNTASLISEELNASDRNEENNLLTELHQDKSLANTEPPISYRHEEIITQNGTVSLERVIDKENVNLEANNTASLISEELNAYVPNPSCDKQKISFAKEDCKPEKIANNTCFDHKNDTEQRVKSAIPNDSNHKYENLEKPTDFISHKEETSPIHEDSQALKAKEIKKENIKELNCDHLSLKENDSEVSTSNNVLVKEITTEANNSKIISPHTDVENKEPDKTSNEQIDATDKNNELGNDKSRAHSPIRVVEDKLSMEKEQYWILQLEKRLLKLLREPFEIMSLLKRGQFSNIFKCQNSKKEAFALKLSNGWVQRKRSFEVANMVLLMQNDIPVENVHFIKIFESFGVGFRHCCMMEYFPTTLDIEIKKATFHIDQIKLLSRQLIAAIAVLRHNNVVHSDIRPSHILLNHEKDNLKLCGFDEACYYSETETVQGHNIGTVNYKAPEVILGYSAGYSIDVWAAGLVMFEMATGRMLFPGTENNDILFKQICTLGTIPLDMIKQSLFGANYYEGPYFLKQKPFFRKIHYSKFFKNSIISRSLRDAYRNSWLKNKSDPNVEVDYCNFIKLLSQMLKIHPNSRIPIEFAYVHRFFNNM